MTNEMPNHGRCLQKCHIVIFLILVMVAVADGRACSVSAEANSVLPVFDIGGEVLARSEDESEVPCTSGRRGTATAHGRSAPPAF